MPRTVLDPGHGGRRDAGGSSALGVRGPGGTLEKDVTFALARQVADSLGDDAVLTRTGDENPTLEARSRAARERGARVFLSLHANRGAVGARGTELWVHPRTGAGSIALARQLLRALRPLGVPDRGIKAADMGVLRPERHAPGAAACLLEVDFLSHPEGERRLRDPRSLARLGRAIADGVRAFLATGLDATESSSQQAQTDAVLANIVRSIQQRQRATVDTSTVKGYLDAVGSSRKYPYIDGYMNAISEVAAHVLAHASRDVADVDDVLRAVVTGHGGDAGLGQEMLDGRMTELKLLTEIAAEIARRVSGVGNRYTALIAQFDATGISYFFSPSTDDVTEPIPDVEDFKYGRQDDRVAWRPVKIERIGDQATIVFDEAGQMRRVPMGPVVDAPPGAPSVGGYQICNGRVQPRPTPLASIVSYILLYWCGKNGKGNGTEITYVVDGKRYLAKKSIHDDGPTGPRPGPHAGMDVYVQVGSAAMTSRGRALDVDGDGASEESSVMPPGPGPTTVEDIPFGIEGESPPPRVAHLETNRYGSTMVFDCLGAEVRASMEAVGDAEPAHQPDGYRRFTGDVPTPVAFMTYVLLHAYKKWNKSQGCETPFCIDGKWWLGKLAIHNDSSVNGPLPYDHPGVDLYEEFPARPHFIH
jgi:N-acetylmuramoyl-L-alanine amidase